MESSRVLCTMAMALAKLKADHYEPLARPRQCLAGEQICESVDDFCDARKNVGLWAQKFGYRDTELLRWAAVVHRMRPSPVWGSLKSLKV